LRSMILRVGFMLVSFQKSGCAGDPRRGQIQHIPVMDLLLPLILKASGRQQKIASHWKGD
jgi:hypothetical protein